MNVENLQVSKEFRILSQEILQRLDVYTHSSGRVQPRTDLNVRSGNAVRDRNT